MKPSVNRGCAHFKDHLLMKRSEVLMLVAIGSLVGIGVSAFIFILIMI